MEINARRLHRKAVSFSWSFGGRELRAIALCFAAIALIVGTVHSNVYLLRPSAPPKLSATTNEAKVSAIALQSPSDAAQPTAPQDDPKMKSVASGAAWQQEGLSHRGTSSDLAVTKPTTGLSGSGPLIVPGDPRSIYDLASRVGEGTGMARDLGLAAQLFEMAAMQGLPTAQYRTGKLYEKGLGVTRDLVAAKGWYQRAAENGNALAAHQLAVLIAEGVGGKPDYATAMAWFRRAAQYGVRDSQFNLAVLLARGLGTTQDLVGAYTWLAIAAIQGDKEAAKKRDEVGARLSPAKIVSAKLAANRWRPETSDKIANEVESRDGWRESVHPKRTASAGVF